MASRTVSRCRTVTVVRAPPPFRWSALYVDGVLDHQMEDVDAFSALSALSRLDPRPFSVAQVVCSREAATRFLAGRREAGFPRLLPVRL